MTTTTMQVQQQRQRQRAIKQGVLIALQILVLVIVLVPFFWMFSVSLKPENEPFAIPARLWPENPTIENYRTALYPEFIRYFINSVIVSSITMVVSIGFGFLSAYAFDRLHFRGRRFLLVAILLAQMFPVVTMIIPIYQVARDFQLINTYPALVIAYLTITLPVATWMLRGFIHNIPPDLEEAAMVDGCTRLQAFLRIIVPLARPGIVATAVWIAVVTWQEFIFALAFTTTRDMRTVPIGMMDFIGQFGTQYGQLMAGSVIVSFPILVIFFFLQRYLVAGLTAGSVRG
jgi:multiple sugar transport system permease protein/raffinose/stachyose/melibiose transport system permease protein